MPKRLPRVVLVGRINAGKSTLFNTLTESRRAIVSPIPGTTRDLNQARIEWRKHAFNIIDTGGLDAGELGEIERFVQKKSFEAIATADCVVYVLDGRTEPNAEDRSLILKLRKKIPAPLMLAVTKMESQKIRERLSPLVYRLGIDPLVFVSGVSGMGTGDLLDEIVKKIKSVPVEDSEPDIRLSIIGKTNVGKSSILNAIIGEEKVLVTPLPHTTREPNDTLLEYRGGEILLTDTAGRRKKKTKADSLEQESIARSLSAIERSDISLIVTDVSERLSSQDQAIATLAYNKKNGILLAANKKDRLADDSKDALHQIRKRYYRYFPKLVWAPLLLTSAQTGFQIRTILKTVLRIHANRNRTLEQEELDQLVRTIQPKTAHPRKQKKSARNLRLQQIGTCPPQFELYAHRPERIHPAFLNHLEKRMRTQYDFSGTPLDISLKSNTK